MNPALVKLNMGKSDSLK